jgi:hypothetical protein
MVKIKLDPSLYDRAKRAAEAAGYSSVEEFIAHAIENELAKLDAGKAADQEAEDRVKDQLRGLGYID